MTKLDIPENLESDISEDSTPSIFNKRLENGDRFFTRAVASLLIPILMVVSIYLSMGTGEIEIENFYSTDVEFMEKQVIDGEELNLYAINIEEYGSFSGDGMGYDSEETINQWNPDLVKSADELIISVHLRNEDSGVRRIAWIDCTNGIQNCDDIVRSGGEVWAPANTQISSEIYMSYDSNWFSDSFLIVAVEDGFTPKELFITLDSSNDPTKWFFSMAITPLGVGICLFVAKRYNRDELTRGITFSNDQLDESRSSYALCLVNTVMKPTVIAFYSSLIFWILVGGDFWSAGLGAIMIGLLPAFVRLFNESSPIPGGRRMNLWGAILYFPLCFFAVSLALSTYLTDFGI